MKHDVAIYVASARTSGFYDRSQGRAGGAERQMTTLALALAAGGDHVAHVVYPPRDPITLPPRLTLVNRSPYAGRRRFGAAREALAVWRALRSADAAVVVVRTASPVVGVAAALCRFRRRALVFSSSNISDFTMQEMHSRLDRIVYGLGVRAADAVVVQSEDQRALAFRAFPSLRRVVTIPSFVELPAPAYAPTAHAEGFLWFGRAVPAKQPLRYVDLARDVPEATFRMIPVPVDRSGPVLEAIAAAAKRVPNLELLDPLPHDELQKLIARAAAIVNTSVLEGMPNAFLEAWSCGVPVLTLEFDPDEIVARHGLGVSAGGSWEKFADGARALWRSRGDRQALADRLRVYVEEVHSPSKVVERWQELLREDARTRLEPGL